MDLNLMCERDDSLWMTLSLLIYFYAVEYHLPHRVMRQFGKFQDSPPMEFSTDLNLHGINRRWRYRHTDWAPYHYAYVLEWVDRYNRSRMYRRFIRCLSSSATSDGSTASHASSCHQP